MFNANTKCNKDMVLYWFMIVYAIRFAILGIPLLIDLIDIYCGLFKITKSFLYYFLITPPWYLIALRLVYVIPFIWVLRVKNMSLEIDNDNLFYTDLFKKKYIFKASDIKFYRTSNRYSQMNITPIGYTITIHLSNKIIWLWDNDTNVSELLEYLKDKKVTKKKSFI